MSEFREVHLEQIAIEHGYLYVLDQEGYLWCKKLGVEDWNEWKRIEGPQVKNN